MASLQPLVGNLGVRRAAHLLRRAAFGGSRAEIDAFANMSVSQAVTALLDFPGIPAPPQDPGSGQSFNSNGSITVFEPEIVSWWIYHAVNPNVAPTAFHKLVFFMHTCVTVSWEVVREPTWWWYHKNWMMTFADKSYRELMQKMSVDMAMGRFLNLDTSTKNAPNENYARELLELFTVGKGPQIGPSNYTNYTEDDIRTIAKVFTGFNTNWWYDNSSYWDSDYGHPVLVADPSEHDISDKTLSAAFNNATISGRSSRSGMFDEVNELIDVIFAQEATSEFLVRKLYRYYVHYQITPEIEQDIIQPLAQTFRNSDFHWEPVLTQLLNSRHFYDADDATPDDDVIGGLIKTPFELWAQNMRYFGSYIPNLDNDRSGIQSWIYGYQWKLQELGMYVWAPPSVAGYEPMYQEPDFNRYWINSTTLPRRYNEMTRVMAGGGMPDYGRFDAMSFVANNISDYNGNDPLGNPGPHEGPRIASHLVSTITEYLFPVPLTAERNNYFLNDLLLDSLSEINWMFEWDNYRSTGDDSAVRPQIENLISGILQSPEFQLS